MAFINSIFDDFGTGIVSPVSGVVFHNRASGFVLEPGHPNAIAGRKRPLNTIIPAMVTKNGKAVMPFGVTGGQFQPFGQVEVLTNIIDYGMGIQAAIDAPRIFARGDVLEVESTVPAEVAAGLSRAWSHRRACRKSAWNRAGDLDRLGNRPPARRRRPAPRRPGRGLVRTQMLARAGFHLFENPRAARSAPYGGDGREAILSLAAFADAKREITSWPGYAPTPLRRLSSLAARVGVGEILV